MVLSGFCRRALPLLLRCHRSSPQASGLFWFLLLDWRFCGARVRERVWEKPWLAQMIYTTLDTFYVSHQQMLDSPSRRDGVDENVENLLRIYGCEIIQECGILLKLYIYLSLSPILLSRFFDVWCILSHLCTEDDREFCW